MPSLRNGTTHLYYPAEVVPVSHVLRGFVDQWCFVAVTGTTAACPFSNRLVHSGCFTATGIYLKICVVGESLIPYPPDPKHGFSTPGISAVPVQEVPPHGPSSSIPRAGPAPARSPSCVVCGTAAQPRCTAGLTAWGSSSAESECLNSNLPFIAKCTSGKGKENGEGLDPQASSTQQSNPASREVALSVLSAACAGLAVQAGPGRKKKTPQPARSPDSLLQSLPFNRGIKNPLAGFGEKSLPPGTAPAR
nr:uncharacterized protein LOC125182406 [Anser cygnoides]